MTREEEAIKILADIIFYVSKMGYIPYDTDDELCAVNIAKKHIGELLPSIPSNLDDAVIEWCKTNNKGIALCGDGKSHYLADGVDAFKAGTEWMVKQRPLLEDSVAFQKGVQEGRRLEREDVKSTIQSRIDEILGDAQPNPVLRMELQELIKKIEA